jgi:isopentenyl-diphosphate delta-isomerase
MAEEFVVLVDEKDREIGTEEKMKAHRNGGMLHRAFSVFIFDGSGRMMLQKRAKSKYHAGGLWTNTCCSHPRKGESVEQAAHRKLRQEMGFDSELKEIFSFIYKAPLDSGLTEHELDHVFVGIFDGKPKPNPDEADGYRMAETSDILADVRSNPAHYTPWFRIAIERVAEWQKKNAKLFMRG